MKRRKEGQALIESALAPEQDGIGPGAQTRRYRLHKQCYRDSVAQFFSVAPASTVHHVGQVLLAAL